MKKANKFDIMIRIHALLLSLFAPFRDDFSLAPGSSFP